jgi:hypothetical protein
MSWQQDGRKVWCLGCCAEHQGYFCFRAYWLQGNELVEVPLPDTGTGRGWLDVAADGYLYYAAWEGNNIRPSNGPGRVPGAVPWLMGGGSSGFVWFKPSRYTDAINGQVRTGSEQIDVVTLFGLPGPIVEARFRFTVQADSAGVRGRLGSASDPSQMTPMTQVAGEDISDNAMISLDDGRHLTLSVVAKGGAAASAKCWLSILGYTPK